MATASARAGSASGPFVFFDLETTGLNPRGDRIIEIAGLRVAARGEIADRFHRLVRIEGPVPRFITSITGITDDMLQDQEPIAEALPRFIDFVGDLPLVAYNVSFDMGFLSAAAGRLRLKVKNVSVCACRSPAGNCPTSPITSSRPWPATSACAATRTTARSRIARWACRCSRA